MCFDMAGEIDAIGGYSYNTDVTKSRMDKVDIEDAQRGDVVLFDWDRDGLTDHVGIVEANLGDGWLQTIEGNTSPSNAGSQSAGNGVYRRQRSFGIDCVLRPKWSDTDAEEASDGADSLTDKWWGKATNYAIQASMGLPANGWIEDQGRGQRRVLRAHWYRLGLGRRSARRFRHHRRASTSSRH